MNLNLYMSAILGRNRSIASVLAASFLLSTPALCQGVSAPSIRVLTLESSRSFMCGSLDFTVASGNAMNTIRTGLTSLSNFGPGGTVDREVEWLAPVLEFNESTLVDADVVLITNLSVELSECEILDLVEFVRQGGGLFAFSNNSILNFDEPFGAQGHTSAGSGPVTITDPNSPVIQGPFGTVPNTINSLSFHRTFAQLGPNFNAVLATSDPVMGEISHGAGQAVVIGDEEWCSDGVIAGCAAGQLPNPVREQLFLNAFASVVPPVGFLYTSNRQCIGAIDCSPASVNSRGTAGIIYATGSLLAADNSLTLHAERLPLNEMGFFLNGTGSGIYMPPQSDGSLCLIGGPIGRYNGSGQILSSGGMGRFELALDLNDTPTPFSPIPILMGETWRFQAWYRDGASNNFTDAIEVTFQ